MVENILLEPSYKDIYNRVEAITPQNVRQWGKMDLAQMLAHLSNALEEAIGTAPTKDVSNFLTKNLVRWAALSRKPFSKNLPTAPTYLVTDERSFDIEKKRLLENITKFYEKGQKMGEFVSHPAFGKLSKEDWGLLSWKHLDHHLRQFSA